MPRYENFTVGSLNVERIFNTANQSIGASSAGKSADIWNDCPSLNMMVDPTLGIHVGDDFASVATTGFPYAISGTNGTFLSVVGTTFGAAQLATAGADNDECFVSYNNNLAGLIKANVANPWYFEARIKISQITLAQGVFVGLAEEAGVGADFMADNTMAIKVVDYIGFQILAATDIAAIFQTVMALNGGARVAVSATAYTPPAATFIKLGMKSVLGKVTFFVNGAKLATTVLSTAANFPLNQIMCPTFATKAGQGTANTMDVDWWFAAQLR